VKGEERPYRKNEVSTGDQIRKQPKLGGGEVKKEKSIDEKGKIFALKAKEKGVKKLNRSEIAENRGS